MAWGHGGVAEPLPLHEVVLAERIDDEGPVEEGCDGAVILPRLHEVAVGLVRDQRDWAPPCLGVADRSVAECGKRRPVAAPRRVAG